MVVVFRIDFRRNYYYKNGKKKNLKKGKKEPRIQDTQQLEEENIGLEFGKSGKKREIGSQSESGQIEGKRKKKWIKNIHGSGST